jgi:hypothetical protein
MATVSKAVRAAIAASRAPSRDAILRWQAGSEYRALVHAFADCPLDRAETAAKRAERLLSDGGWAQALLDPLVEALTADRFFEPPFKVSRDSARIGAILYDCPAVSLTASVTNAAAMKVLPPPETIVFTGRVAVTRTIKAGGALMRRWRAEPMTPAFSVANAGLCTRAG